MLARGGVSVRGLLVAVIAVHVLGVGDLLEALDGLLAVEERGGFFEREVLRLEDGEEQEDDLEREPDNVDDLREGGRVSSRKAKNANRART